MKEKQCYVSLDFDAEMEKAELGKQFFIVNILLLFVFHSNSFFSLYWSIDFIFNFEADRINLVKYLVVILLLLAMKYLDVQSHCFNPLWFPGIHEAYVVISIYSSLFFGYSFSLIFFFNGLSKELTLFS